ncbi:MAG: glycosyltransferase family 4 protein [Oligoflexia bacterium]|nr:glycosyltransferase family 4 protein [Oligoflexia bacterium]
MEKWAIILSKKPSSWVSCTVITPNLEKAYLSVSRAQKCFFNYFKDIEPVDTFILAKKIKSYNPKKIIFIDHCPHPLNLLKALDIVYSKSKIPELVFHLYGDFTILVPYWERANIILKKTNVSFICASERQKKLVSTFLRQKSRIIGVCPFSYDAELYNFEPKTRTLFRKKYKIKDNQKIICYTGRLSAQKNVLTLLREISKVLESEPNVFFFVAGKFDDISAPFFGARDAHGTFLAKWNDEILKINKKIRERIIYLGNLDFNNLKYLYNGSDIYISLSTFHDEDFGMAPLEALVCGCSAVLSDWGGYAGFKIDSESCQLIPIKITKRGLTYNSVKLQQYLKQLLSVNESIGERIKRSEAYKHHFSVNASRAIIEKLIFKNAPCFKGFSRMTKHLRDMEKLYDTNVVVFPTGPIKKSNYYNIYKNYIGE